MLALATCYCNDLYREAARLGIPVFIHTADPQEFWQPIDYSNERWLELALFPGRRYPAEEFPSFEQLMTERDNLLRRHPRTTFVIAHMGWHANDLGRLGKLMAELPNVHTEVGAVLYDIGRQPRVARDFFVRFQDRILFGKDWFQPQEYPPLDLEYGWSCLWLRAETAQDWEAAIDTVPCAGLASPTTTGEKRPLTAIAQRNCCVPTWNCKDAPVNQASDRCPTRSCSCCTTTSTKCDWSSSFQGLWPRG